MKILVVTKSLQIGFFSALGALLAQEHEVCFTARSRASADIIARNLEGLGATGRVIVDGELGRGAATADPVAEALEREARYGVPMALLLAHDRALGKGYIFNADRYPDIRRSWWPMERKLASLMDRFAEAEALLDEVRPDLVLSLQKSEVMSAVARSRGVACLNPAPVKLGSRWLWSDDDFITSSRFLAAIQRHLGAFEPGVEPDNPYAQESSSKYFHSTIRYGFGAAVRGVLGVAARDTYQKLRGLWRDDSYRYLGWAGPALRKPLAWRYFLRHGKRPADLAGRRLVYVPLHLEPEVALLALSPEFNNSQEMIAWLSKAVPADTVILVKEQPFAYGIRSLRYYDNFRMMGNVALAEPTVPSWDWINAASAVATITGTAATEGVYFGKPVVSFGRHQAVNLLPTVHPARCYEDVRDALPGLLAMDPGHEAFARSRQALNRAQVEVSFDLSGFEHTYKQTDPATDLARTAHEALLPEFEGLAGRKTGSGEDGA